MQHAPSEVSWQALFREANLAILIFRANDEVILEANPAACELYGCSREDLIGQSLKTFTLDVPRGDKYISRIHEASSKREFKTVHYRVDGTPIELSVRCSAITFCGEDAILCFARDISEKEQTERALRASEDRWWRLIEQHPEAIIVSVDAEVRYINRAGVQLLGARAAGDVIGRSVFDAIDPAYKPIFQRRKEQVEHGESTDPLEHRIRGFDGHEHVVQSFSTPIIYEGKPALQTVIRDVTEQKAAAQRFADVLEAAPDALIFVDKHGTIVLANRQTELMFGYEPEALIGQSLEILLPERFRDAHADHLDTYFANPRVRPMGSGIELRALRKDGEEFPVDIRLSPLRTGENIVAVAAIRDITEHVEREQALRRARNKAEAASRAKSAFLANMSHEIRTPMNGVIGMTDLLLDTELDVEQREFVETIRTSGRTLLDLLNNVLDFSKIEAEKLTLEERPFEVRTCVEEAIDAVAQKATEKDLELVYILDEQVPDQVIGDVTRVRQVLLNLLSNAVKFTHEGEIVLQVNAQPCEPSDAETSPAPFELQFIVRDTGIGIPEDRADRLFEAFDQVDVSTTRKYGGTGLGLAITQRLCEMMGGTVSVESTEGDGSTFTATITVQARSADTEHEAHDRAFPQAHLLIVDDNASSRQALRAMAERWGARVATAATAEEAMERIQTDPPFDAALIDLHMPEKDGLTFAREVRQSPHTSDLPVVFLVPLGTGNQEDLRAVGDALVRKPVKAHRLRDALLEEIDVDTAPDRRPRAVSNGRTSASASDEPLRVLVAEDNEVNRKVTVRLLEQLGVDPDIAGNGVEVLERLERTSYDVILMDVQMPQMDGVETTRHIKRQYPEAKRPQIIALTAAALQGDRERFLEAGMDDYVAKPIDVDALVDALESA